MNAKLAIAGMAIFLMVQCGCAQEAAKAESTEDVFKTQAEQLTSGKTSRIEKLQAVYAFVRDGIAQVVTSYG